jgi:hypothetical protein
LSLYGLAQDRRRLFGRGSGHFALIVEGLDHHVKNFLQNQFFAESSLPAFSPAVLTIARHSSTQGNTSSMEGRAASLRVKPG